MQPSQLNVISCLEISRAESADSGAILCRLREGCGVQAEEIFIKILLKIKRRFGPDRDFSFLFLTVKPPERLLKSSSRKKPKA